MYKNQWYHVQDRGALFLKQSFGIWSLNNNYRKHQEKDPEKLGNEVTVLVNYLQWILKPFFFRGKQWQEYQLLIHITALLGI